MRLAVGAALVLALAATACAPSPADRAFAAAKAAVRAAPGAPTRPGFQDLALRSLAGLKGSKAQVVCGTAEADGGDIPFIYVWTLAPAVADPGLKAGQVLLMAGALDRRAADRLNHFCSDAPAGSAANPYDYFE